MTLASDAISNSPSAVAAAFIVGQSESLPIKIPTRGLLLIQKSIVRAFCLMGEDDIRGGFNVKENEGR